MEKQHLEGIDDPTTDLSDATELEEYLDYLSPDTEFFTTSNGLCSSSPFSSREFSSVIRNIGKFGAKNYFTDHRTANTIYSFRDLVS